MGRADGAVHQAAPELRAADQLQPGDIVQRVAVHCAKVDAGFVPVKLGAHDILAHVPAIAAVDAAQGAMTIKARPVGIDVGIAKLRPDIGTRPIDLGLHHRLDHRRENGFGLDRNRTAGQRRGCEGCDGQYRYDGFHFFLLVPAARKGGAGRSCTRLGSAAVGDNAPSRALDDPCPAMRDPAPSA